MLLLLLLFGIFKSFFLIVLLHSFAFWIFFSWRGHTPSSAYESYSDLSVPDLWRLRSRRPYRFRTGSSLVCISSGCRSFIPRISPYPGLSRINLTCHTHALAGRSVRILFLFDCLLSFILFHLLRPLFLGNSTF